MSEWPQAWKVAEPPKSPERPNYGDGPSIGADVLRLWSERLCREAGNSPEELAAALGVPGSLVVRYRSQYTVEPPPEGTREVRITRHTVGFEYVSVYPLGIGLTRAHLEEIFGEGRELPRVHWDSPSCIAYDVRVAGAPYSCAVFAYFIDLPIETAVTHEITLRRDRAYAPGE